MTSLAASTPLRARAGAITSALKNGEVTQLFHLVPRSQQGALVGVLRGSFTSSLDEILLVAAIFTFAAAVLSFVLIRLSPINQTRTVWGDSTDWTS